MAQVFIAFVLFASICLPSFAQENTAMAIKIVISGEIDFINSVESIIFVKKDSDFEESDEVQRYKIEVPQNAKITKDDADLKFDDLMEGDKVTVNTKFESEIFTAETITVN